MLQDRVGLTEVEKSRSSVFPYTSSPDIPKQEQQEKTLWVKHKSVVMRHPVTPSLHYKAVISNLWIDWVMINYSLWLVN